MTYFVKAKVLIDTFVINPYKKVHACESMDFLIFVRYERQL